ncbi:MAG: PD-(D/E)XK nuclease family protein [Planctomycetota bacterium]
MTRAPHLVFLGWNRPPLAAAAEWLHEHAGEDMGGLLVALPGARAGRRLREILARRIGARWRPPRILTAGALVDELLAVEGRPAGRTVRTLAWVRALQELPGAERERIAARAPEEGDLAGWTRIAEEVRALFGEVAAEGLDFARVAERVARSAIAGETARWRALARAQTRMAELLAAHGLVDPHLGRLAALAAGRVDGTARVVLAGVVDMNGLLRRTLELVGERATALVPAPAAEAAEFDALGCLRPAAWAERDVPLELERWRVAERPGDQAEEAMRLLATWNGRFAAEEITLGVADPELVPYLRQRLAAAGVTARDAAGLPLERTRPVRLLAAVQAFLAGRRFADYAALLRHPDLEAALAARPALARIAPAELLDAYQAEHLPAVVDGRWRGAPEPRAGLAALHAAVEEDLGELARGERRALPGWADAVRGFLLAVYDSAAPLDPAREDDRVLGAALAEIASALEELAETPPGLAPPAPAAGALDVLLRTLRGRAVPPPVPRPGEPAIELLGWLELVLDDARALVVTGFQDGRVPEAVPGDAFLPDSLRRELGLVDDERRLARDVYALHVLRHAREEVAFVSARRDRAGDPLRPSRLAFHRPPAEIAARVRRWLSPKDARLARPPAVDAPGAAERARRPPAVVPDLPRFWVTWFRTYLESPYLFYLRHVLELETLDDRAREMDPLGFGNLAHEVLRAFGASEWRDSDDPAPIAAFLREEARRRAALRFGRDPLPAVELQIEQLVHRFGLFASRQAARVREGWRIAHCEWTPEGGGRPLPVAGGEVLLVGRVDRLDRHDDGRWAILDYKTGETVKDPAKSHRKEERWIDLQLPLYAWLAREVVGDATPFLGFAALGKDPRNVDFLLAKDWDETVIEEAVAEARRIVETVRAGGPFAIADARPREPILAALLGQGLLERDEDGTESEA